MRVCLLVPGFSASESDWCVPAVLDLVRRMADQVEPWVLALRYPFEAGGYSVFGVPVRALGTGNRSGVARALMAGRAVRTVIGAHRQRPFDLVHGLWADEAGLLSVLCGRLLGRPAVVSVMGGELVWLPEAGYGLQRTLFGRGVVARSLRWASRVTVGSAALAPRVAAAARGRRPDRLPLGVDVERFREDGPQASIDGDPAVMNVASLSPVKDQGTLIEAFVEVRQRLPSAHLHLVGDGPLRGDLERVAGGRLPAEAITFHGAVAHHELPALYRAASLHVVSSRFESQSMATLEAAACGVATVGTEVGVLPELGDGVRTGPAGDSDALAGELLAVLSSPELPRIMGRNAHEEVLRHFTLDQCTARFLDLYRELISDSRQRQRQ